MGVRCMELANTELIEYNIVVHVYEPPDIPFWNLLPVEAKELVSRLSGVVEASLAKNTTTLEMHEWLVSRTDPFGTTGTDMEQLAVGRSSDAVSENDTQLNDEVDRVDITSSNRETDTLRISTFLDKNDGNVDTGSGESLSEVGLFAGDFLLNHALLSNDIDKTNTKTATIDVLITYDAA